MTHATAAYEIASWEETPLSPAEGHTKLTRAAVSKTYTGDIEGRGSLEYLMSYAEDGSATFVGMERIAGRVGKRTGSFVLQHTGIFENGVAKSRWSVVPGSGSGDLTGLRGEGSSASARQERYLMELDYDFA